MRAAIATKRKSRGSQKVATERQDRGERAPRGQKIGARAGFGVKTRICEKYGKTNGKCRFFEVLEGLGFALEGSGGPAGEPETTIESDWHRLVRSRARVGGSRAPRESQGARQGVSGVPGGSQGIRKSSHPVLHPVLHPVKSQNGFPPKTS